MGKIFALVLMLSIFFSGSCLASIERNKDDFHGTTSIYSSYEKDSGFLGIQHSYVLFLKTPNTYLLIIADTTRGQLGNPSFEKNGEIKIDGTIYNLEFHDNVIQGDADYGQIAGRYIVPEDLIPVIRTASKITVRGCWACENRAGNELIIDIPDKILNEWKKVIDTQL